MKAILLLLLAASAQAEAVRSRQLSDAQVDTGKIAIAAVDTPKLNTDAVTTPKIITAAVDTSKLATDSVTTAKILNGAVGTSKLAADAAAGNISSSTRVGFGTSTPDSRVDIEGSESGVATGATLTVQHTDNTDGGSRPIILIKNGGTSGGDPTLRFSDGTNDFTMGLDSSANKLLIGDNTVPADATTRLAIDGNGNVGIGTTVPGYKLHLSSGTLLIDGNTNPALRLSGSNTGKLDLGSSGVPGCILFGDNAGTACTECTAYNGVLNCGIDADCACDGIP